MTAKFGPAGNSNAFSAVHKSSLEAPQWIREQGLDCYEYQCGKGVHIGKETAEKLGEKAREAGITLSLHAPYFINLANPESIQKNNGYVLTSAAAASWMGATRIVVHSGTLMGRTRREALEIAKRSVKAHYALPRDYGEDQPTWGPGRGAGAVRFGPAPHPLCGFWSPIRPKFGDR